VKCKNILALDTTQLCQS